MSSPVSRLLAVPVLAAALAAQGHDGGSVAFRQACLDATTDALVLNLAAHPDDEADRTLTWLRHAKGVRTVTVYTTCGSGGQNAIGREIGPALARIRVRETLAAARHTGVDVRWLGFHDFGYSKRTDETLRVWGGLEELTNRLARIVDELRPDVVITNHGTERGHGHHRATAVAIREVLAQRAERGWDIPLYERMFSRGFLRAMGLPDAQIAANPDVPKDEPKPDWFCDPFELDPVRGTTYARQASQGRHEHATQGPWRAHDPARTSLDQWKVVMPEGAKGDLLAHLGSVFDDPTFKEALSATGKDAAELVSAFAEFAKGRTVKHNRSVAHALLPVLREIHAGLEADAAGRSAALRLARRIDALQRLVLAGSGVHVEVDLADSTLLRGGRGTARVLVHAVEPERVSAVRASCRGASAEPLSEERPDPLRWKIDFAVGDGAAGSNGDALAVPFEPEWVEVDVELEVDGMPIVRRHRLAADLTDQLELAWGTSTVLTSAAREEMVLSLRARYAGEGEFDGRVDLELPPGVEAQVVPSRVSLRAENPSATLLVRLRVPGDEQAGEHVVRARLGDAAADLRLVRTGIAVDPGMRIGLVRGPDDTLQRALEDLGIAFEVLDETSLAATDLSRFSVVVLDIRVYHHRPDLAQHRERIVQFCADGGRIVSFYHKAGEWNARKGRPLLAPYKLKVASKRVCEEDAAVTLLQPDHRLWTHPHRITTADFEGWVQERGLNFPSEWDERWVPLIEMSDTDEDPLQSAMLYAEHGDGDFVYCSLALYRQLRVGHQGAVRILMNLLTR